MAKLYNLARMSTATTGTGTITLNVAVSGYLTFALAGVSNGDVVSYGIKDGANSEVGTGTYTSSGTTLTRTVSRSTNANAAISLSGTAEVFITPRAEDLLQPGAVIGSSLTSYTNSTALSTLVPLDDTIPTISEGDQLISTSYTPQFSNSKLRCTFRGTVSNGSADNVVASIFQGSTNIGAQMINVTGSNTKHGLHICAEYSPGTISAQTISVRAGGGTTAIYFNGTSVGRLLGGAQAATLLIEEIKV